MPGILDVTPPSGINPGLLSAQQLVSPNAPPVITPNAVQAMTDSMRSGALTAQDVMDRLGELGKTSRKAAIELHKREIEDLQDPDLVAARHAIQLAAGAQARNQQQMAAAVAPNIPLAGATQAAQLKAALWDAQLHGAGLGPMQDVLMKAGWAVPSTGASGAAAPDTETQQEIIRRYQAILQHQQELAHANDFLTKTDKTEMVPITTKDATGKEITISKPVITYGGRIYEPETRDAVQKFLTDPTNLMPSTWDAKGRPNSPSRTPEVPTAGAVVPITDQQRAELVEKGGVPPEQAAQISVLPRTAQTAQTAGIITKQEIPLQDSPEKALKSVQEKDSYKEWDKSLAYADLIARRNSEALQPGLSPKIQNERDIALTEAVIKLYDPAGVLRSFKWDKTTETRPIFEYISELKPMLLKDQILTTPQRNRLTAMANDLISARERVVQPDLQRVKEIENQWGRSVLNSRERAIAEGKVSQPGAATPAAGSVGPVITLNSGIKVQRGSDGKYYPAQ